MNGMSRRVVITGCGVVSALGMSRNSLFENLLAGKSAVRMMDEWLIPVPAAPVTDFVLPEKLKCRQISRTMSKSAQYCAAAALEAQKDAGWDFFPENRTACIAGSTFGSPLVLEDTFKTLLASGSISDVSPMNFFKTVSHTAAYNAANVLGIDGMVYAPAAACASGLQSVGLAATLIACGECDVAIAGGSEELSHMVSESFILMDAQARQVDGTAADDFPRPFDRQRNGLVCSEGAAMLVLEEYESARKRNAPIIAEISAYAVNRGKNTVTQSESSAVESCLKTLLSKLDKTSIGSGFINAHATGTLQGDQAEAEALRKLFGESLPVSSCKGHLGHTLGAAGALELAAALEMLRRGILINTRNLSDVAAECSGLDHLLEVREKKCDFVLKNSFAFGGINAAMLCCRV